MRQIVGVICTYNCFARILCYENWKRMLKFNYDYLLFSYKEGKTRQQRCPKPVHSGYEFTVCLVNKIREYIKEISPSQ